jgi:RNA polymerase sigma-70 factor, ECF subfamily
VPIAPGSRPNDEATALSIEPSAVIEKVMDEAALLTRASAGDEAAFVELYARYQRQIFHYAARMCGVAAGDDVVQETFLAVLRHGPSTRLRAGGGFDPAKGTVAGYLYGIARHHVIKRLDRQGVALSEPVEIAASEAIAPQDSPLETMARERMIGVVRQAVQSLPPAYREVVALCDLQEMDYATVAQVIQCPIGTVRSRLHRARGLLLRKLSAVPSMAVASRV